MEELEYPEFVDDSLRIQQAFLEENMIISVKQAESLWIERSESWDANWLILPKENSRILSDIYRYTDNCKNA